MAVLIPARNRSDLDAFDGQLLVALRSPQLLADMQGLLGQLLAQGQAQGQGQR